MPLSAERLPDLLFPRPRLVFIGTAAGAHSARVGAYYAKPGNKFWPTLHTVGLTPVRFEPQSFRDLEALGIGLTDICKTEAGMDHQIAEDTFDIAGLKAKLARVAPDAIAFTSKKGASIFLNTKTRALSYGRQAGAEAPAVFVLHSPSGAAGSHWTIEPWRDLARWFHER